MSQPKSRRHDKPKIKILKKKQFGVTTIVYSRKLRKNQNNKTRSAKKKTDFGSASRLRVGKVLASHNTHPNTIPLIKHAKGCDFPKYLFSPKIIKNEFTKETKIIFWFFLDRRGLILTPTYLHSQWRIRGNIVLWNLLRIVDLIFSYFL